MSPSTRAFVLGAGLGKRLQPLTHVWPKPLIPVFDRPLISWAFDHLRTCGVHQLAVNTHHLSEVYQHEFAAGYPGLNLHFRHEPVLMETGGGIWNLQDFFGDERFLLYNGDILTDLPLEHALQLHDEQENDVTLVLRRHGGPRKVLWQPETGRIVDIAGRLGVGEPPGSEWCLYTGLAVLSPSIFSFLVPGKVESVVEAWLRMLTDGGTRIMGCCLDDGVWSDLGTPQALWQVHQDFLIEPALEFPRYSEVQSQNILCPVAASACLAEGSKVDERCVVMSHAELASGARLEACVVLPKAQVLPGHYQNSILFGEGKIIPFECSTTPS